MIFSDIGNKNMAARILFTLLSFLFFFSGCAPRIETPQNPNIIYVLADDLGYGDISILNPEGKIPTPHIDQLARDGVIFTDVL